MLTIMVSRRSQWVQDVSGLRFRVRKSFVMSEKGLVYLQSRTNFEDVSRVEIVMRQGFVRRRTEVFDIPQRLKEGILTFLRTQHAKQDWSFDCYAFVCLVYGVPDSKDKAFYKYWNVTREDDIGVGDVVYLSGQYAHFAIYIGRGVYISVWGAGGDLEFATLDDMQRDFKTAHTFRLRRCETDTVEK